MTQQENMAGKELVVDSIRILKSNGFNGAGAVTYDRKIDELEQKVTVVSQNQERYTDISDDKTITSEEKQTLKKEVLVIETEYPLFIRSAEAAGVTITGEYVNYIDAYTSLTRYLTNYLHVFDDMTASTDIPSRSNFNAYFQVYYECRQQLQDVITKGYAESYSGLTDQNAIPVMELSAPVVMVTSYTAETPEYTEYEPGYISFHGLLKHGEETRAYETRFKVFRNGEDTPVYQSSKAELSGSYPIPIDTTSLRVVMYDQLGNIIYDNETIDFITKESGTTLHLSNKYQTFYNGSVNQSRAAENYFRTVVMGFDGLERRPIDLGKFPEVTGLSFRADGDNILISPTAEIESSGEVTFNAFVEITDADDGIVYGIGEGDDAIIIGIPDGQYDTIVMGEFDGETQEVVFDYSNIEHEELRENLQEDTGRYLGYYYNYLDLPKAKNGDYILFVGQSIDGTIWKNGLTYKWNGIHWEIDNNPSHEMATVTDALKASQSLLGMDPNAMAVLLVNNLAVNRALINKLFTNQIEVSEDGFIAGNYEPGKSGFYLGSNGRGEFNDVEVRGKVKATMFDVIVEPGEETITSCEGLNEYTDAARRNQIEYITFGFSGNVNLEIVYNKNTSFDSELMILKNKDMSSPLMYIPETSGETRTRTIENYEVHVGDSIGVYGIMYSGEPKGRIQTATVRLNASEYNPIIDVVFTKRETYLS
ncbi:MAG: hypothetical protein MJZ25_13000 [Fibrobacter sp.]|nr:hypothetical protein [Fibrobacter sp.]